MWQLFVQSKTWRCRPSELMAVDDPIAAYCLDSAIEYFGTSLENELNAVQEKDEKASEAKRKRILLKWIPEASSEQEAQMYADPAGHASGRGRRTPMTL